MDVSIALPGTRHVCSSRLMARSQVHKLASRLSRKKWRSYYPLSLTAHTIQGACAGWVSAQSLSTQSPVSAVSPPTTSCHSKLVGRSRFMTRTPPSLTPKRCQYRQSTPATIFLLFKLTHGRRMPPLAAPLAPFFSLSFTDP